MAIFGVLKAGKIYVALNPAFPEARTSFIVADSQAQLIVTNQANYAAAIALVREMKVACSILTRFMKMWPMTI